MRDLVVKCALQPDVDSMRFQEQSDIIEVFFLHLGAGGEPLGGTVYLNPTKARAIIAWLERALAEPDSDEPEVV